MTVLNTQITPGSGALATRGQQVAPRQAPRPVVWLPEVALVPSELNYDQTVDLISDQFEVAMNDSQAYLQRVDFAALSTGLLDPSLVPDLVEHISGGVIDEHELHVFPGKIVGVIRGRDAASYMADSTVYLTFSVDPTQPAAPEVPSAVPGFPALPVIPGVTVPLILHGQWRASDIARELLRRVGLSLVWQTYDYYLRETITVTGSVLQTIQSLVEPFSHFERSKVDIWAEGTTVVIRSRGQIMSGSLTSPQNFSGEGVSMDAHDSRIQDLLIRAKFGNLVRVLRILGSDTGSGLGVAVTAFHDEVTTDEMIDPDNGETITRIVTTTHIRDIDGAQINQTVETFKDFIDDQGVLQAMARVSLKETVSDWDEPVIVFPNTLLNRPKENSRVIVESTLSPDNAFGSLVPQTRTIITHSYSADGYLSSQDTRKEIFDSTPAPASIGPIGWTLDSSETKQYERNGAGMYQITTTQFGSDGVAGDVRRTTANGTPPGGPGRSLARNASSEQQLVHAVLISNAPGAKDITINNRSLLLEHMHIIASQAQQASGATEVEISFSAAGMPWIRRGQYITLTGLFAEDGTTPVPLQPALVTESRIEYRESSESPTYLTYVKALFWET